jgi:hypothetical protein
VFLSTNAASEVFEWSELEAGIFSHAVRSGLMGAADANGDGRVSYAELHAFVGIASSALKNPVQRPQVFARGPGGNDDDTLIDLRPMDGTALRVDAGPGARLTVRDRDSIPWIDLNPEDGFGVTLRLPRRAAEGAFVEESHGGIGAPAMATYRYPDGRGAPARLSELSAVASAATLARGPSDLFRSLFAAPFGPKAFAAFQAGEPARRDEVYGVSTEDRERMGNMLDQVADIDRATRLFGGGTLLTLATALGAAGAYTFANASSTTDPGATRTSGEINLVLGGAMAVAGGLALALPSSGERLRDYFVQGLRRKYDPLLVVANTEKRLREMAEHEHTERLWLRWTGVAVTGASALGFATTLSGPWLGANGQAQKNAAFASAGAVLFIDSLFPRGVERMWKLWSEDPGLTRTSSGAPVHLTLGLGGVGLSGIF